jgi:hypothetical protein
VSYWGESEAKSTFDLIDRVSWASEEAPVVVEGGEGVGKLEIAQVSGALSPRQGWVQVPEDELSSTPIVKEVEPLGEQVQRGLKSEEPEEGEREEGKLEVAQVNYALSPGQVVVLAGQQWSEHQPDQVGLQPVTTIIKGELPQVDPDPLEGLPNKCDLRLEEYAGSSSPARKSSSLRGAGPGRPAQEGQIPGWPVPAVVEEERPQVDPDPSELHSVARNVKVEKGPGPRQHVPMVVEEELPQVDPDPPGKGSSEAGGGAVVGEIFEQAEKKEESNAKAGERRVKVIESPSQVGKPWEDGAKASDKGDGEVKSLDQQSRMEQPLPLANEAPPPPSGSIRADVPDLVSEGDGRMFQGVPWPSP